jgi:hypothetical protein
MVREPDDRGGRLPWGRAARRRCRGRVGEQTKMEATPNKITGPNAGGPRQFPIRTSLAARVGQFGRWPEGSTEEFRVA